MSIHAIPEKKSNKPGLQTFMLVTEKETSTQLHQITSPFGNPSVGCNGHQVSNWSTCLCQGKEHFISIPLVSFIIFFISIKTWLQKSWDETFRSFD